MKNKDEMYLNISEILLHASPFMTPVIVYFSVNKIAKKYTMYKNFKANVNATVLLPPKIPKLYTNINKKRFLRRKYGEEVLKFAKVITENMPQENLTNFYNNINTLNISLDENFMKKKTLAYYLSSENKIYIREKYGLNTIYHELFHMISTHYDNFNQVIYGGFSLMTKDYCIAKSINEGYTQLLTERYFSQEDILKTYVYEQRIANMIEIIVGKSKMEKLYLSANLYGLVEELKKYADEREILKIFADIDYVSEETNKKHLGLLEHRKVEKTAQRINNFFIYCYAQKIAQEAKEYNYPKEVQNIFLKDFISEVCIHSLSTKYTNYNFLNCKGIVKAVEEGSLCVDSNEEVACKKNC